MTDTVLEPFAQETVGPGSDPQSLGRILAGAWRRMRLLYLRLRFPSVKFGSQCDIRGGLQLQLRPGADLRFGSECVVDRQMTIECEGTLHIGERTIFGHHCTVAARSSVIIGPDCLIAEMVSIRDHNHRFDRLDIPVREQGNEVGAVRIGRNVWLGGKVTVVSGVTIGDNAIIGANAVVTRDIPANAIAVGVPAKVIRFRGETP